MTKDTCKYTKIHQDGYGATWKTSCGKEAKYAAPEEVGMCFPPLPTDCGTYCTNCGKRIVLVK